MAYVVEKWVVDSKSVLKIGLVEGGGCAVSLVEGNVDSMRGVKKYK